MKVNIINIGDELLIGQIVNTNASFIASELLKNQIQVLKISVVGDEREAILLELSESQKKYDVTIMTGGLGPTHDDITIKCISEFFNSELVLDNEVLSDIKTVFEKRGRTMSPSNEIQAYVPNISEVIRNAHGTAPGTWTKKDNRILISLPGVPHEMKEMLKETVIPRLNKLKKKNKVICIKNLLTTGIPESVLYEKLGNIDVMLKGAKLAFLPNQYGVKMRVTVTGKSDEAASDHLSEIEQKIRALVGRYIYGTEDTTIEEVVGRLLNERGLKISVAESCTGGLISNRLTNVSGSSSYFERGVVSYSNGAKVELLKVNEDTLMQYGAVSHEVAMQMAEGIKSVTGTDIGLSTTGILGPTGATPGKPIGLVYVGLCFDKVCTAKKFQFGDDRLINKDRASQAALDMLRRFLLGIPEND